MDGIYILLFILVLYFSLKMIVEGFLALSNSNQLFRVRARMVFRSFGAPVILAIALLFVSLTDNQSFNILLGIALIISSLIRAFWGTSRYLTSFRFDNSQLVITYLTPLFKTKTCTFQVNAIQEIEMAKANGLIDHPASCNVKYKNEWIEFCLIDKKLITDIGQSLVATNISIPVNGAE